MTTENWRRLLVGLGVFGYIQLGIIIWWSLNVNGTDPGIGTAATQPFFVTGTATKIPFVDRIAVTPGTTSYQAGLRAGDLVDLRPLSAGERYRWFAGWRPIGQRIDLAVVRHNGVRRVTLTAQIVPLNWDVWVSFLGIAWMFAFAIVIALRRSDRVEGRILALMLIVWNIGNGFFPINWSTPWAATDAIVAVFGAALYYSGFVLFATYALTFAPPPSLLRRVLAWLSYASVAVNILYAAAYVFGVWTLTADPTHGWYFGTLPQIVMAFPWLFPLLCAGVTIAQTRGAQRARLAWAAVPLGSVYALSVITSVAVAINPGFDSRFILYLSNITTIVAPLGLTYSLLSRRVLDITFALNRALVFSAVSIVVVGIFVLIEWALSEWLGSVSHAANLAISAALALVLGLSVRAIHLYVDRALDTVFFRKRHEDEKAIRAFAREVTYITDIGTLVARAKETLERHAGASFVELALDDGAGHYGGISENDPSILALRTWHKIVDLHTMQTGLHGEFAYPMIARGRLLGALVLGPKRSGESYAPDESDAIAQLAHGVGGALDILTLKAAVSLETLSEQLRDLRDTIVGELRALRSTIEKPREKSSGFPQEGTSFHLT